MVLRRSPVRTRPLLLPVFPALASVVYSPVAAFSALHVPNGSASPDDLLTLGLLASSSSGSSGLLVQTPVPALPDSDQLLPVPGSVLETRVDMVVLF